MFVWSHTTISSIYVDACYPTFIHIHSSITLTKFELVDEELKDELHIRILFSEKEIVNKIKLSYLCAFLPSVLPVPLSQ